mmetsp:Transcript_23662/g.39455  ORF Transcript_23662/g.39455 Transcript_23662/m.39455 type:complete len:147 (+) Transcript_23662:2397-2837(+)
MCFCCKSTFGGNPLACRVATEAVKVILDEDLAQNATVMGERFRSEIRGFNSPLVQEVRGQGLLNSVVVDGDGAFAWSVCVKLAELGLLAKPTHGNIIRFAPPLVINDAEVCIYVRVIGCLFVCLVCLRTSLYARRPRNGRISTSIF